MFVFGDFNAPLFNSSSVDRKSTTVYQFMEGLSLRQLNNFTNANGRLLDLIFTTLSYDFTIIKDSAPLVPEDSYHPALFISMHVHDADRTNNLRYYFKKADLSALYTDISETN
ncbi:hypothetical protein QE152_g27738 [Popillia japonica]|uniref:Endonuclease/exonuclease/phosphatase domain-containing protein n=1 Tax=Popillia japonica TaxID=7064 RepID=A0AAW1JQZ6_POPJA